MAKPNIVFDEFNNDWAAHVRAFLDASPITRPLVKERSGTLKIASLDAQLYTKVIGAIPTPKGLPKYTISITTLERAPCPSPWRHPLRWLRWNPFLRVRVTTRIYDATFHD